MKSFSVVVTFCAAIYAAAIPEKILISPGPHRPGQELEASWRLTKGGNVNELRAASLTLRCRPGIYSTIISHRIESSQVAHFQLPQIIDQSSDDSQIRQHSSTDYVCQLRLKSKTRILAESERFKVSERNFYGVLTVLGYRYSTENIRLDRNAKYYFYSPFEGNGLVPVISEARLVDSRFDSPNEIMSTVSVSVSRNANVNIPCRIDPEKDMFQVGRDSQGNDFFVPGHQPVSGLGRLTSRFSFRIVCDRTTTNFAATATTATTATTEHQQQCRVFAAGYDQSKRIFLGPSAARFFNVNNNNNGIPLADGFITYALMLWTPSDRRWREISVLGRAFHPRSSISSSVWRTFDGMMEDATNILEDGAIIMNGGTGYLWRSASGLASQFSDASYQRWTPRAFNAYMDEMQSSKCPVDFENLRIDIHSRQNEAHNERARIYPHCGHLFNSFGSAYSVHQCPACRNDDGKLVEFQPRYEPFISLGRPTNVLSCGHAMTEECAQSAIDRTVPRYDLDDERAWKSPAAAAAENNRRACPFCGDLVADSHQKIYAGPE